jgi:hypothetical protein
MFTYLLDCCIGEYEDDDKMRLTKHVFGYMPFLPVKLSGFGTLCFQWMTDVSSELDTRK